MIDNFINRDEVIGFHEAWFVGRDVAEWIEHSNPSKMIKGADLENDEKVKRICEITNSYGTSKARNSQEMLFVTESGLYELIMQSRVLDCVRNKAYSGIFLSELPVKGILKQYHCTWVALVVFMA
jgi:hypothetical protein